MKTLNEHKILTPHNNSICVLGGGGTGKSTIAIVGAYYYDEEMNAILIPHFTGEYAMVDCDRYLTKKDILEQYEKQFWIDNKENFVEYEGVKYYYAEYFLISVDENWILLSDLSKLRHIEEDFDF